MEGLFHQEQYPVLLLQVLHNARHLIMDPITITLNFSAEFVRWNTGSTACLIMWVCCWIVGNTGYMGRDPRKYSKSSRVYKLARYRQNIWCRSGSRRSSSWKSSHYSGSTGVARWCNHDVHRTSRCYGSKSSWPSTKRSAAYSEYIFPHIWACRMQVQREFYSMKTITNF